MSPHFLLISSTLVATMFIIFVFVLVKLRKRGSRIHREKFSLEGDSAFKKKINNMKGEKCLIIESNNYTLNISTADKRQRTKREYGAASLFILLGAFFLFAGIGVLSGDRIHNSDRVT